MPEPENSEARTLRVTALGGVDHLLASLTTAHDALAVILRDPAISSWLRTHDPMAHDQAREALAVLAGDLAAVREDDWTEVQSRTFPPSDQGGGNAP